MTEQKTFRERYLPPDAIIMRRVHLCATIIWGILIIPSILWWRNSIMWIVLMSAWANFASHFAAWQAARGEVKQDEINEDGGD